MKTARITNPNGRDYATKIYDAETGAEIHGVTKVEFVHEAGGSPRAALHLFMPEIDAVAPAAIKMMDPATGEIKLVKRIEFSDGTVFRVGPSRPIQPPREHPVV